MSVNSISNSSALSQLVASTASISSSSSSAQNLTSELLGGDSANISTQGLLLSELNSLPNSVKTNVSTLQSDLTGADLSSMSDDDLKDYLTKMKSDLGSLPGALKVYESDIDNMSSEDITTAKSILGGMKSMTSSLGEAGSMLAYMGMSQEQSTHLVSMLQQASSVSSSAGTSVVSLLKSYNPTGQDSTGTLYSNSFMTLISSYNSSAKTSAGSTSGTTTASTGAASSDS